MVKEIDEQGRANLTRRRIMADENKIRSAGLAYALPDERERDNLIMTLSSRERGYGSFSMRDRMGGISSAAKATKYLERGYSSNRATRNDFDREARGRRDRRRDY